MSPSVVQVQSLLGGEEKLLYMYFIFVGECFLFLFLSLAHFVTGFWAVNLNKIIII
jgi:hypothetical protein